MRQNVIISGVGGQGILTIARILSLAAVAKGLYVKQAEVHGMSQRGGAVYSHLRLSDEEIYSDLIPAGQADMILSVEPMEALRYLPNLREGGMVVTSTNAEVNIADYPPIEKVLSHLADIENHVAIDMEKLARAAGSVLSANVVALGAASIFLDFSLGELQDAVHALFAPKGERVLQTNLRALRFGRTAAIAYREAIQLKASPPTARGWIASLSSQHLASELDLDFSGLGATSDLSKLTGAEAYAFESLLMGAYSEGRSQLYEHEVYRLVELVGAITPPRHTFIPKGSTLSDQDLKRFPGGKVVLKLVSAEVVHKTEAGAVLIVPKELGRIRNEIDKMVARHLSNVPVAGVLVVEFVEHDARGLGSELFVGIRATREFGPVIAAGLGGVQTEYLALKMLPGVAVAKAVALDVDAEEFLELFRQTVAYDVLAGRTRGHERLVSDGELLRCFRAFISIARQFCVDRGEEGPDIGEFEVNPFAFSGQHLIPLDGRGCLRTAAKAAAPRPLANVPKLLEPASIALIGVSSKAGNFGRIILSNIEKCGFDPNRISIIKADEAEIDGVKCVPTLEDLPGVTDLLVIMVPAAATPSIMEACTTSGRVRAGIIISGGAGETEGSEEIGAQIQAAIQRGREREDGGTVFIGPNCMGLRSLPGHYDTFFVPDDKLPPRRERVAQPIALLSQSGAFIVSRLSSQTQLHPSFAISIGNQCDLTISDLLHSMADRRELKVIGVYLEGFADLDGLESIRAVSKLTALGKTVVFYKAGRTESGRSAAAGHTAAIAGDYEICHTAMRMAGAMVAKSFREFNLTLDLAACLADRSVGGGRVFAVTNAGMEAVAMADSGLRLEPLDRLKDDLNEVLAKHRLAALVRARNPLDLTPQGDESAYDDVVRAALASEEVDAVIVSCVPLAPCLHTLSPQLADPNSFVQLAREWLRISSKAIVFVLDGGPEYDALGEGLRDIGLPVYRSADEAASALRHWISRRSVNRVLSTEAVPS